MQGKSKLFIQDLRDTHEIGIIDQRFGCRCVGEARRRHRHRCNCNHQSAKSSRK
ncbi:hypothetical protein [Nostoc sp. DedQUE03]|uniref:hypothetical protein n=1 Tax=Nostoc sp. DedQUE03 TaxID=3075389 RepID=UPI002AD81984|nr:hypothetical protein [Nostoc sp. DedQUE03]